MKNPSHLRLFKQSQMRLLQQGVVLPITLIALLILLIASVALIRSTETNLMISGNMAFRRDLVNQAERALPKVETIFESGALSNFQTREADVKTSNYFSTRQASNASGIPNQLLNSTTFDAQFAGNNIVDNTTQITIRYLIDRMCLEPGPVTTSNCTRTTQNTDTGGDATNLGLEKANGSDTPIYRLSIRATGPRNTEAFFQYTFTL
jgi:type IV pilus assembly protein PilX